MPIADELIRLKEQYKRSPASFAAKAVPNSSCETAGKTSAPYHNTSSAFSLRATLLPKEAAHKLENYELLARDSLDLLSRGGDAVFAFQVFDRFGPEIDNLIESYIALFRSYSLDTRRALDLIDQYLGNSFIVFVAILARRCYDGEGVWIGFFKTIGVKNQPSQIDFKKLFIDKLSKRSMPYYLSSEVAHRYFYTALLHGGLSEELWSDIWMKILPLARRQIKLEAHSLQPSDVLQKLRTPDSPYYLGGTVRNVLAKAPTDALESLLFKAFKLGLSVAHSIESSNNALGDSLSLPKPALTSLNQVLNEQARRTGSPRISPPDERYKGLPHARLEFCTSNLMVYVSWDAGELPEEFGGSTALYLLDGREVARGQVQYRVGLSYLKKVSVPYWPNERTEAEIRIVPSEENKLSENQPQSLRTTIDCPTATCLEFVQNGGECLPQRASGRLTKNSTLIYVAKPGYQICAVRNMQLLRTYESDTYTIQEYRIGKGSSGSIVDIKTGEIAYAWNENYDVQLKKEMAIGRTEDGLDLYGYTPGPYGTNVSMPFVAIKAADSDDPMPTYHDIDLALYCDGIKHSVSRTIEQRPFESDPAVESKTWICLDFSKMALRQRHIRHCHLVVSQRSSGKPILSYHFAVAPISGLQLAGLHLDRGNIMARYEFMAYQNLTITGADGVPSVVYQQHKYRFTVPLRDESVRLSLSSAEGESDAKKTSALLGLAFIDVQIPSVLLDTAKQRRLCLADILNASFRDTRIQVSGKNRFGTRKGRLLAGDHVLAVLDGPDVTINLSEHTKLFSDQDGKLTEWNLFLAVEFSSGLPLTNDTPSETTACLLRCMDGFGFTSFKLKLNANKGVYYLMLDSPARCQLVVEYIDCRRGSSLGSVNVGEGDRSILVLEKPAQLIKSGRAVSIKLSPLDIFGDPDRSNSVFFLIPRRNRV